MVAKYIVLASNALRKCRRNWFLSNAKMYRAPHLVARVIFGMQGFFNAPQTQHLAKQWNCKVALDTIKRHFNVVSCLSDAFVAKSDHVRKLNIRYTFSRFFALPVFVSLDFLIWALANYTLTSLINMGNLTCFQYKLAHVHTPINSGMPKISASYMGYVRPLCLK